MSKVHYISAWSNESPPNIGGAINAAIAQLNADDNDWIVNTDCDFLWLRSDSKKQLEEILSTTEYDLLGPITNRLSSDYQLFMNMVDEDSITKHIQVANQRHDTECGSVWSYQHILAAFCLCFRVKTWRELGGFIENSIQFDTIFSLDAQNKGLKLGLMGGIYGLHLYRWGSSNPCYDIKHLV